MLRSNESSQIFLFAVGQGLTPGTSVCSAITLVLFKMLEPVTKGLRTQVKVSVFFCVSKNIALA